MSDDKVSDKLTLKQIKEMESAEQLMHVVIDQQFDYWYDPCGKSGHTLNGNMTPTSRLAMRLLFKKLTGNNP